MFPSYSPSLEYQYLYYFGVLILGFSLLIVIAEKYFRRKAQLSAIWLFVSGLYFFIYTAVYIQEHSQNYHREYPDQGIISCIEVFFMGTRNFLERSPCVFRDVFNLLSMGCILFLATFLLLRAKRLRKIDKRPLPYHLFGIAGLASLIITFTPVGIGVAKLRHMLFELPAMLHHQSMYERWLERKPNEYYLTVSMTEFEPGGCPAKVPVCSYKAHIRDEAVVRVLENTCTNDIEFSIQGVHRRAHNLLCYGENGISCNRFKIPVIRYNEELGYIEYLDEDNYHSILKCGSKGEGEVFRGYSLKIEAVEDES